MLRPLEWSERAETTPGLEIELGVFAADGTQVFTTRGAEESAGLYRADVSLEESRAGENYILRWRLYEEPHTVISTLTVFVTGERLPASAISVLNEEG